MTLNDFLNTHWYMQGYAHAKYIANNFVKKIDDDLILKSKSLTDAFKQGYLDYKEFNS